MKRYGEISKNIAYSLILSLTVNSKCIEPIQLIEQFAIKKNRIDIKINSEFKKAYLKDDFFVEYDEDIDLIKLDYSIVTLPFIMNVISLIWVSGKEYTIKCMDKDIYESLERIKKVFQVFYPKTPWNGKLIPQKLVTNKIEKHCYGPQCMTAFLFSGGVDSTAASFAHRDKKQLLITAWGQSCLPLEDQEMWNTIKKHVTGFAQEYGHENAFIKSNYYSFLNLKKLMHLSPEIVTWRIDTIEDIGWTGLTAPILVTRGIQTLHIASTETWKSAYPTAANPFIDGNISYASIHIKHDHFDLTRFDKLALIHDLSNRHLVKRPQMPVCQKRGGIINCGTCEKCCITILCLLALDADPLEYGFRTSYADVKKNAEKLFIHEQLSTTTIEQCIDLQKRIAEMKPLAHDLSWFLRINFSKSKAYDLRKQEPVDWRVLSNLFPDIKTPFG